MQMCKASGELRAEDWANLQNVLAASKKRLRNETLQVRMMGQQVEMTAHEVQQRKRSRE